MDIDSAQKAISAALNCNWREAVKLNREILQTSPKDVDALNRLARAYAELGDIKKAKALAEKVLMIDPVNPIASKALKKWKGLKEGEVLAATVSSAEDFLEEPGKTKLVSLLFLGDQKAIAKLDSGDKVRLLPSGHRVSVLTPDGKYIGRLPDDLSSRLRQFIKMGNVYEALVKSLDASDVKIFIREVKRVPALNDIASFSTERIDYVSFTPPELVHKKNEMSHSYDEE